MHGLENIRNEKNKDILDDFCELIKVLGDSVDNNLNNYINKREKFLAIPKEKCLVFDKMLNQFNEVLKLSEAEQIKIVLKEDDNANEFWDAVFSHIERNKKLKTIIQPVFDYEYEEYEKICRDFFENNVKYNGISELEETMHYNRAAFSRLFKFAEQHIIENRETKTLFQSIMKNRFGMDVVRTNILWELFDDNRDWLIRYKTMEYINVFYKAIKSMENE